MTDTLEIPTATQLVITWVRSLELPGVDSGVIPVSNVSWNSGDDVYLEFTDNGGFPKEGLRIPIFQVTAWAYTPNSTHSNFPRANKVIEQLFYAADQRQLHPITVKAGFHEATISVRPLSEPQKVFNSPPGLAGYQFRLLMDYVVLGGGAT